MSSFATGMKANVATMGELLIEKMFKKHHDFWTKLALDRPSLTANL